MSENIEEDAPQECLKEETIFTSFVDKFMSEFQKKVQEGYIYVPNTARVSTIYKTATLIKPQEGFSYKDEEFQENEDLEELKEVSKQENQKGLPDWDLVKTFETKDELAEYASNFGVKLRKNQKVENMIKQFIEDLK